MRVWEKRYGDDGKRALERKEKEREVSAME
jgi:hypothetical protein